MILIIFFYNSVSVWHNAELDRVQCLSHIYELNEMFEIIVICHVCFSSTKEKSWSFPGTITRVKIHQVHYNKVIWNKVKSWLSGTWNSFTSGDKNKFQVIQM